MTQKEYFETRNLITQYYEPILNTLRQGAIKYLIYFGFLFTIFILTLIFGFADKNYVWVVFWLSFVGIVFSMFMKSIYNEKISNANGKMKQLNSDLLINWEKLTVDEFLKKFCTELFSKEEKPLT